MRPGEGAGTVGWFLRWFPAGVPVRADVEVGAQPVVWETLLSRGKVLVVLGLSGYLSSEGKNCRVLVLCFSKYEFRGAFEIDLEFEYLIIIIKLFTMLYC